jgi:NADH:ubiquinone oxidoreductase subunit F (NADH-binding)
VAVPEQRVVLANCGVIDPRDIQTFLDRGGFEALEKARSAMTPEEVIRAVRTSRLRGRGGAGFDCGLKWELARGAEGEEKFLICNADEGEVGTFKDRFILENDPFTLIEGIAITAHAIGAGKAYVYLRAEYHHLLALLLEAIGQARERGFLDFLDVEVCEGAGAYVCGEESALMNSIEGRRGEARFRPPFPTDAGLWGCPTIINNVETLMNIPPIIAEGSEWFRNMGTAHSKGTKVFSVSGDVGRPGVYELVMGSRLGELVLDLAEAANVKMVQVGGAGGRIVPAPMMDTPLSYETVLGSGGITVFDESRSVIDIIHRDLEFFADESCGKCAPCREGTEAMVEIFGRLSNGDGRERDVETLKDLSEVMMLSSLCGLGQGAGIPVLDSLRHFRHEYEDRIEKSLFLRTFHLEGPS